MLLLHIHFTGPGSALRRQAASVLALCWLGVRAWLNSPWCLSELRVSSLVFFSYILCDSRRNLYDKLLALFSMIIEPLYVIFETGQLLLEDCIGLPLLNPYHIIAHFFSHL